MPTRTFAIASMTPTSARRPQLPLPLPPAVVAEAADKDLLSIRAEEQTWPGLGVPWRARAADRAMRISRGSAVRVSQIGVQRRHCRGPAPPLFKPCP
jgi:hypothetical protein